MTSRRRYFQLLFLSLGCYSWKKTFKGHFDLMFSNFCVFINLFNIYKIKVSIIFSVSFCFFRGKWFSLTCWVMCSERTTCPWEPLSKSHLSLKLLAVPLVLLSCHLPGHLVSEMPSLKCRLILLEYCPGCVPPYWKHSGCPCRYSWHWLCYLWTYCMRAWHHSPVGAGRSAHTPVLLRRF